MERMSDKRASEIFDAVVNASLDVRAGIPPDQALYKQATELRMVPEEVKRAVEAFNVRATLGFLKEARGAERAESFPIASPEAVLKQMFPLEVETPAQKAASLVPDSGLGREFEDFKRPPVMRKAASEREIARTVETFPRKALSTLFHLRQSLEKKADQAETDIRSARRAAGESIDKLAYYFREIPHLPFEHVEKLAVGAWPEAKPVMDLAWKQVQHFRGEKRASVIRRVSEPDGRPFDLIREALKAPARFKEAKALAAAVREELSTFKDRLFAMEDALMGKKADALSATRALLGIGAESPESPAPKKDPLYEAELAGIRAQSSLHDLLTSDDVISRHPPVEVIRQYNQLAESNPGIAASPLALRAALRKLLEAGGLDEYDVSSLADTQLALSRANQPLREAI